MPPRGPRKVLCVVVVTKSACAIGLGCMPAGDQAGDVRDVDEANSAPTASAISPMRLKSMMRG